jgi:hypothetical protein
MNILTLLTPTLKAEITCSSETLVYNQKTTWHNNSKDQNIKLWIYVVRMSDR